MKKAILLCAGLGMRLRPITNTIPKCLVEINGKPLLQIWLENLTKAGVTQFLINTHHLHYQINEFVRNSLYSENIKIVHEKNLLGTAGTLKKNLHFYEEDDGLLIHADNYCTENFNLFFDFHNNRVNESEITMMVFKTNDPISCGIVEIDDKNIVNKFYEKVKNPPGNTANAAIYILSTNFIQKYNHQYGFATDFSTEVLPNMMGKINAFLTNQTLIDIGTKESLKIAQGLFNDTPVYAKLSC